MQRKELNKYNLPDLPGVYIFKKGRKVLYIGKATSLRDRVRSYFDDDLVDTRGPRIVDVVTKSDKITHETTPTVLEALVREVALIKKYRPRANAEGKDDKTFLYAVITQEDIPRVLVVRGKDINFKQLTANSLRLTGSASNLQAATCKLKSIYGPFPSGAQLREGLRLIRRIFPFFDTDKPVEALSKQHKATIEFNQQIDRYPYLSAGRLDKSATKEYRRSIRNVMFFLSGRGKTLRKMLAKKMKSAAKNEEFEKAAEIRRQLFALDHIQDVSLIKDEHRYPNFVPIGTKLGYRIEAYDTAHLSGTNAIGVMVVVVNGVPVKSGYRTFRIRGNVKDIVCPTSDVGHTMSRHGQRINDDIASLKEVLSRRLKHQEWEYPRAIVVDGGKTHKKAVESLLKEYEIDIKVVAVVKDEKHRPREIIGARLAGISEADVVLANSEAHRFSLARHRRARSRNFGTS